MFDGYAMLQESRSQTAQFPYRYSHLQEELLELRRDFATRWPRCCSRLHPHAFFLTTEEIHALLTDPLKLGSNDIGSQRVVYEDKDDNLRHIVHANSEVETVISHDDMMDLGWSESHIKWLLSQVGVPDDDFVDTGAAATSQRPSTEAGAVATSSPRASFRRTFSHSITSAYKRDSIPLELAVEQLSVKSLNTDLSSAEPSSAALAAGGSLPGVVTLEDELTDLGFGASEAVNDRAKVAKLPPVPSAGAGKHSEQASIITEPSNDLTRPPVRQQVSRQNDEFAEASDLLIAQVSKMTEDIQSQLSDLATQVKLSNQEMKEQISDLKQRFSRQSAVAKVTDAQADESTAA